MKQARERIASLNSWKEKAEYIWQYYHLWIIGFIAAVLLIIFSVQRFFFHVNDNWFYIMFANTRVDIGDGSNLWKDYVSYTGYDLKEKNVVFNASSYFDYKEGVTGNSYFESFVAFTEGGTLDAITMETDSLAALGESGRLLDLNSEECTSIREKYGDRFIYCKPYDEEYSTDEVPIGIDISDSLLMSREHIYAESCALGIGAGSGHLEAVEAFLDLIYEEE